MAEQCLAELREATPKDSGLTAESWGYKITSTKKLTSVEFYNNNIQNGINIALLVEYGHITATGGWVEGREYIDPVIQRNYLKIVNDHWKELNRS